MPCIILDISSRNSAIMALVENIQRQDLSFFDEASAIEKLITYYGMTQEDAAAKLGDPNAYKLPKPKIPNSEFDFSFSGLKTAVINTVHNAEQKGEQLRREDMAASFQKTVADTLVERTMAAAKMLGSKKLAIAGGVSANSGVRGAFEKACADRGIKLYMPELKYCGDNAAMIACQGYYDFLAGKRADESLNGIATLSLDKISEEQ